MKIKTSELQGPALDYAVARAEGNAPEPWLFKPSSDWAQGGPIIEREQITLDCRGPHSWEARIWVVHLANFVDVKYNSTPLIAAMRCYVVSKLGEEVEVPNELA